MPKRYKYAGYYFQTVEYTPSWAYATEIGAFKGDIHGWLSLSPGMRREIVRDFLKRHQELAK